MTQSTHTPTSEPEILTANTYFWHSGGSASHRRSNEERRKQEVAQFFRQIGLVDVSIQGDEVTARTHGNCKEQLEVCFSYSESCRNVYKHLSVTRDGRNSNITALRKLYN